MATQLGKVTDYTRKILIVFGIFSIISILLQIFSSNVPVVPPGTTPGVVPTGFKLPDNALGLLPHAKLASLTLTEGTKAKFALDGKLPGFPNIVNAYSIRKPRELVGNADRARNVALVLGFKQVETRTEGNLLIWELPDKSRTFSYDKTLDKWSLQLSEKDPALLKKKGLNIQDEYYTDSILKGLLTEKLNITSSYFTNATTRSYYVNRTGKDQYQSVESVDKANYLRTAIYKSILSAGFLFSLDPEHPGVYSEIRKPNYLNGSANFILQGDLDKPKEDIIAFNYHDYVYDQQGIYKALSVEEAYNNIQANKGFLYWLKPQGEDVFTNYQELSVVEFRINVKNIRIVYIEPDNWIEDQEWTHYLEPFYIFEGTAVLKDGKMADFAFLTEAIPTSGYK